MRKSFAAAVATASTLVFSAPPVIAQVQTDCSTPPAAWVPGATVVLARDVKVYAKFCGSGSGYTSDFYLAAPQSIYLGTGHVTPLGHTTDLGTLAAGQELVFGIYVRNTGLTYYSGPASRNPDGQYHAAVGAYANDEYRVGFEDLFGGGDRDYNDIEVIIALLPATPPVIPVQVDIKPGTFPNSINLASRGVIPVAILGDAGFDAALVDPGTVSLAGASVRLAGKAGRRACALQDANADGFMDLVCHILAEELLVQPGDAIAVLEAKTYAGESIRGQDSISIVP